MGHTARVREVHSEAHAAERAQQFVTAVAREGAWVARVERIEDLVLELGRRDDGVVGEAAQRAPHTAVVGDLGLAAQTRFDVSARSGTEHVLLVDGGEVDAETADRAGVPFLLFTEGYRKGPADAMVQHAAFSDFAALAGLVRAFDPKPQAKA